MRRYSKLSTASLFGFGSSSAVRSTSGSSSSTLRSRHTLSSLLLKSLSLALSSSSRNNVRLNVEGDEKNQVRRKDQATVNSGETTASTSTHVRHVEIAAYNQSSVRSEVNETKVDNELDDLESGNPSLPPGAVATAGQEVVEVHNNVNSKIKRNGDVTDRSTAIKLGETKNSSGTVVVGVQESQRTFSEDHEDSIQQLVILCQVVQVVDKLSLLSPRVRATNRIENTIADNNRKDLLYKKKKQDTTKKSENQVMKAEQPGHSNGTHFR